MYEEQEVEVSFFFFFSSGGLFLSLFSSFCIVPFLASEVFGCFEWLSIFVNTHNFIVYATLLFDQQSNRGIESGKGYLAHSIDRQVPQAHVTYTV
jgi:hypothetical protein